MKQNLIQELKSNLQEYANDETKMYELFTCICSTDAYWKFLGLKTFLNDPPVVKLKIELPGNESIHYPDSIQGIKKSIEVIYSGFVQILGTT